jgi:hypothetical protein
MGWGAIVDIDILKNKKHDTKDKAKYKKWKELDQKWLYHSTMEFLSVFLAVYIAGSIFTMKYLEGRAPYKCRFPVYPGWETIADIMNDYVLKYLLLLPDMVYSYFTAEKKSELVISPEDLAEFVNYDTPTPVSDGVPDDTKKATDISKHRSSETDYLIIYLVSFFFCIFLVKKIANLFLDMFVFKANPMMYVFILLAFCIWVMELVSPAAYVESHGEKIGIPNSVGLFFKITFVFIIVVFIHMLLSFLMTPLAQGIFSIYLVYVLSGGWDYPLGRMSSMTEVAAKLLENPEKRTSLDQTIHSWVFKDNISMFSFLFAVFFLVKSCLSYFHLHIHGLKWFFQGFHLGGFLICVVVWLLNFWQYFGKPEEEKQDFSGILI